MPRKPRVEYAGAVYHVMCRGNGGQSIYLDDADRRTFLKTLGEACERCGWRVHEFVRKGSPIRGSGQTQKVPLSRC